MAAQTTNKIRVESDSIGSKEIMTVEELDTVLDAYGMTQPGISGKELLKA